VTVNLYSPQKCNMPMGSNQHNGPRDQVWHPWAQTNAIDPETKSDTLGLKPTQWTQRPSLTPWAQTNTMDPETKSDTMRLKSSMFKKI